MTRAARRDPLLRFAAVTAAFLCLASPARAGEAPKTEEFHFRYGLLSASYSYSGAAGAQTGSASVPNTLDFEYERFVSGRSSYQLRLVLAHDLSASRMAYAGVGVGRRLYLRSSGLAFDAEEDGHSVSIRPRWRFYAGGEGAVAQVLVKTFGEVLQANSTILEVGGNVGAIYQANTAWGAEVQAGYGYGFGFSSIAVKSSTIRLLLGASYFF